MTQTNSAPTTFSHRKATWMVACIWAALAVAGHMLINYYNHDITQRAEYQWEQRLTMTANHQAAQISEWIQSKRHVVQAIAENVSAQLYLSAAEKQEDAAEAELTFLRNYVIAMADQAGLSDNRSDAAQIQANVAIESSGGLAIIDNQDRPVVTTRHFPATQMPIKPLKQYAANVRYVYGPDKEDRVWIAAPIHAVQDESITGYAVAVFHTSDTLSAFLASGELPDSPATSRALRMADDQPKVIAPQSALATFIRSNAESDPEVTVLAYQNPAQLQRGRDAKGNKAMAISAEIEGTPWRVVREVTLARAMHETYAQANALLLAYWLAVLTVTFTAVALWRHLTAERLSHILRNIRQHEQLLELISEHIPARLMIFDAAQKIRYANRQAADKAGIDRVDMVGKSLGQLIGPLEASPLQQANERTLLKQQIELSHFEKNGADGLESALEVYHVPLPELPEMLANARSQGILMIEQDVTETLRAKYARQHMLASLIETIVSLADMRDPHASHHSSGVVFIAKAIAQTIQADEQTIHTISTAGQLMNLGKLFVPQHVLTATHAMDADDRQNMATAMQRTIEHLSHVPFDGPVIETLRQVQEKVNGSGTLGLTEETLLLSAKILSVANSFVALTSPRAYRDRLSVVAALDVLQQDAGTAYAPAIITALRHYLENLGGGQAWNTFVTAT